MIFDKEFMGNDVDHKVYHFHNYTEDELEEHQEYGGTFIVFSIGVISIFAINLGMRCYRICCARLNHPVFSNETESIRTRIINIVEAQGEELNQDCPICLSNFAGSPNDVEDVDSSDKLVIKLKCNHCFHKECLREWLEKNQTCPVCRTPA